MIERGRMYRSIAYLISLTMILVCIFYGPKQALIFFPFFVVAISLFHTQSTGRFSIWVLLYFLFNMFAEVGFIYDFVTYYEITVASSFISEVILILMLRPLLRFNLKGLGTHNIAELIIGFLGITTLVVFMLYIIIPRLPNAVLFVPTIFSFSILVFVCFSIPLFNRHPNNIYLWGVAIGFIGELLMAFVYEYIERESIFMVFAFILGNFYKLVLINYFVLINNGLEVGDDYM